MGYSTETYRVVKDTLEKRRQAALAESDRRRAEVHEKSDEIAEIDRALRGTGLALFRAACEGGKSSDAFIEVMAKNQALQEERGEILRSLGLPADYTEVHYTCPVCRDSGYTDIRMCDCMRRELTRVALRQSGLGSLIDRQSFENFSLQYYAENKENARRMERTLAICREYAENFSPASGNLIFFGRTGLGKTHLSTAIARTVIERGFDVRYESAPNLFGEFEYDRFKSGHGEDARADKYMEADLLILDDLGTEATTQFTVSCLYNIINTRENNGRPTIINTNLGEAELEARYGDRITSRLFGNYRALVFVGEDVRKQKLK